jgi:hypothetical protein
MYSAKIHFQHFVEGRNFAVYSDHKPLVGAVARQLDPKSERQWCHLSFVSEFTADIHQFSGQENLVDDTLSRLPPVASLLNHSGLARCCTSGLRSRCQKVCPLRSRKVCL